MLKTQRHCFGVLFLLLFACKTPLKEGGPVDHSLFEFQREKVHVQQGPVGVGNHKNDASYVYVDVLNRHKRAVDLTLSGKLLNANGDVLGQLRNQWLRLPADGRRTFALVDDQQSLRPDAEFAEIVIQKASEAVYPLGVKIEEGHVFDDRGRVVVTGFVVNENDRNASALVIASFYDKDGIPVERPSTSVRIDRKQKRGIQFVGPEGSVSATLYVGEVLF